MSTSVPRFEPGEMQRYRKASGLTQEQVAERMKYSVYQYKRWEKGTSPISLANAQMFLDIVNAEEKRVAEAERIFAIQRGIKRNAPLHALPNAS